MHTMVMDIAKSLNIEKTKIEAPVITKEKRMSLVVSNTEVSSPREPIPIKTKQSMDVPVVQAKTRRNTTHVGHFSPSQRNLFTNQKLVENMAEMVVLDLKDPHPEERNSSPQRKALQTKPTRESSHQFSVKGKRSKLRRSSAILLRQFAPSSRSKATTSHSKATI